MRYLWDISIRSPLRERERERDLRDLLETSQKRWLFCDIIKPSKKHLEKDVFCVRSLRPAKYISKRCLFGDVSETSQTHPRKYLRFFKNTPQKWFPVIYVHSKKCNSYFKKKNLKQVKDYFFEAIFYLSVR